jgi:hypothetical protein
LLARAKEESRSEDISLESITILAEVNEDPTELAKAKAEGN